MPILKSRSQFRIRILIGVLLAVALSVGFSQLSLRLQGRIVEFCTFGDWPLEWAVHHQFKRKQPELRSIIEFMVENQEVNGLTVTPVGLRAGLRGPERAEQKLDDPNILQALVSIQAHFTRSNEDRISVALGTEYRGKTSFHTSYVYPLKSYELPPCDSAIANDRPKIGACGIMLSADWYAVYQWEPTDLDELNQALQGMK
jgi:hypothetical protein